MRLAKLRSSLPQPDR